MVSKLDESVGEVIAALRARNMLDNSIVVFLSDNGAPTHGIHSNRGSNYPFRGVSLQTHKMYTLQSKHLMWTNLF
jgi:arylsulfatase A-like enzyme